MREEFKGEPRHRKDVADGRLSGEQGGQLFRKTKLRLSCKLISVGEGLGD